MHGPTSEIKEQQKNPYLVHQLFTGTIAQCENRDTTFGAFGDANFRAFGDASFSLVM